MRITIFLLFLCILLPVLADAGQTQYLKLDEVLQSVEQYYPKIRMAQLEVSRAQGEFISASGKFDPVLNATGKSQPLGGYINNYGDSWLDIPTTYNGINLFAGYRNGQGDWPIYYQNFLTNSGGEYRAGLSLPLLRDRKIDKERGNLMVSAEKIGMKHYETQIVKIRIYHETIQAYWDWVEAGQQLNTFRDLLKLAKTRQGAIRMQAVQGDLARLTITENLQQIMQREQLLNHGKMIFEQASINLSLYYRDQKGESLRPGENRVPPMRSGTSIATRQKPPDLSNHPALKRLRKYKKIMQVRRDQARNELLPHLDAEVFTFKQYGSGGYPLLIPQAAMVGLGFRFPLLQREAKGKLIRAESQLQQIGIENRFTWELLRNELGNLLVGIERLGKQVELLDKEYHFALKVQQGESKKFLAGDSTLFLVNQREQTAVQVKLNLIHTLVKLEALRNSVEFFTKTGRRQGHE